MSRAIDAHLTDEVINEAFEGSSFGRTDFRTILAETVMKRSAGYHSGWTATTICTRLGLLGNQERPTKLGLTFAFHHYYNQNVRDAINNPATNRHMVRQAHAEWSQTTFGNVGPLGPLKHLSKEALEAAAEPNDLSEWADMQFLLWDAQRRAGITDEQITLAMIEKLAVNKQRQWPEPKDGEPRLHIKPEISND